MPNTVLATGNAGLFKATIMSPDFKGIFESLADRTSARIPRLLDLVGSEVLQFLKSYGEEVALPKLRPDFAVVSARPKHPQGFADVTNDLMNSYTYKVQQAGKGWSLAIANNSMHAAFVEAMDGIYVITGITDPGGPVDTALQHAIQTVGLSWSMGHPGPGVLEMQPSDKTGYKIAASEEG